VINLNTNAGSRPAARTLSRAADLHGEESFSEFPERHKVTAPINAAKIISSFNTWSFKREQPDSFSKLEAVVRGRGEASAPLHFVLYWGKGPRTDAGPAEERCLDFLATMRNRISAAYAASATYTLIFTDTHAALNGYSEFEYASYFRSVQRLLPDGSFDHCRLSRLVDEARMRIAGEVLSPVDDEWVAQLQTTAAKWYRGAGDARDGARLYAQANLVERRAVELAFPSSIFATFNGSRSRRLFPERMPIFYMYSTKKGVSVKPWFVA
jgi:hypothetical protein